MFERGKFCVLEEDVVHFPTPVIKRKNGVE